MFLHHTHFPSFHFWGMGCSWDSSRIKLPCLLTQSTHAHYTQSHSWDPLEAFESFLWPLCLNWAFATQATWAQENPKQQSIKLSLIGQSKEMKPIWFSLCLWNKQMECMRISGTDVCKTEKLLGVCLMPKPGATLAQTWEESVLNHSVLDGDVRIWQERMTLLSHTEPHLVMGRWRCYLRVLSYSLKFACPL